MTSSKLPRATTNLKKLFSRKEKIVDNNKEPSKPFTPEQRFYLIFWPVLFLIIASSVTLWVHMNLASDKEMRQFELNKDCKR